MESPRRHSPRRRPRAVPVLAAFAAAGVIAVGLVPSTSGGSVPPVLVANAPASGCADVETIAVRGTGERPGGGVFAGALASRLQDQLAQTVETHDLAYPASFDYQNSVRQGVAALEERLAATSAECPDTEFVLIGYSQGADVVGDALEAGSVPADQIGAVVMFGDPAFNSAEDFATGDFTEGVDGILPRATGALDRFAEVTTSFCNGDDTVCQRGSRGGGHFRYAADLQDAADAVEADLG